MFKLSQEKTKSLVELHGWTGVILGLLLYAVVFTGTVAVLADEIGVWSIGGAQDPSPLSYPVNGIIRDLASSVDPLYHEEVGLGKTARNNLQVFFHTHKKNEKGVLDDYGVQFNVNPATGDVLQEQVGFASDLFHNNRELALSRFLVDVHTELHLPRPWGLLLTGILGLSMMVAAVSGFLMHRHLFTDIFVYRRNRSELLKKRDVHTVAGTWGLPFAFILAFTGSFFSFAGAFGIPAMAMVAFGGDQEALIRTVVGIPETESEEKVATHNIDSILEDGRARAQTHPDFVAVMHYGRGDAKVLLFHPAPTEKLEPIQLEYDGTSGDFIREKPSLGTTPSAGSMAFSLMTPLHFGNFSGLISKWAWVALGFASCYVVISGLFLWLKRREEHKRWQPFLRATLWMGTGLPIALTASAIGYFLSIGGNTLLWTPLSFVFAAFAVLAAAVFVKRTKKLRQYLLFLLTAQLLLLPILRYATGGPGWIEAISQNHTTVMMMDIVICLAAVYTFWLARKPTIQPQSEADTHSAKLHPRTSPKGANA